jgi:hypothetical protein
MPGERGREREHARRLKEPDRTLPFRAVDQIGELFDERAVHTKV